MHRNGGGAADRPIEEMRHQLIELVQRRPPIPVAAFLRDAQTCEPDLSLLHRCDQRGVHSGNSVPGEPPSKPVSDEGLGELGALGCYLVLPGIPDGLLELMELFLATDLGDDVVFDTDEPLSVGEFLVFLVQGLSLRAVFIGTKGVDALANRAVSQRLV